MKDKLDTPIIDGPFHDNVSIVAYDHAKQTIFIKYHAKDVETETKLEYLNDDDRKEIVDILKERHPDFCI